MVKIKSSATNKVSYTNRVQTPDIPYYACVDSWVIVDGSVIAFHDLTSDAFTRWIRAVVPDGLSDLIDYLLDSFAPCDLIEMWYCCDRIAQRGIHVPLYSSREMAEAAARSTNHA